MHGAEKIAAMPHKGKISIMRIPDSEVCGKEWSVNHDGLIPRGCGYREAFKAQSGEM